MIFIWEGKMGTYQAPPLAEYIKDMEDPRINCKKLYPLDELIIRRPALRRPPFRKTSRVAACR